MINGQGTKADYQRLANLRQKTSNKVFRSRIEPNWLFEDRAMWYRIETGPKQHEFILADLQSKTRELAFDHQQLVESLKEKTGKEYSPASLPFSRILFDEELRNVYFKIDSKGWKLERKTGELNPAAASEFPEEPKRKQGINPSGPSRVRVNIEFQNDRKDLVRLFWIDPTGRPRGYGEVNSGETVKQSSYIGHTWVVTGTDRSPLAVVEIKSDGQKTVVNDKSKVDVTFPRNFGRRRSNSGRFARSDLRSPDGKWEVAVRDHNVFLKDKSKNTETQLTKDGKEGDYYTRTVYWSPDSSKFVVLREVPAEEHKIYMIESSPKDQVQPKLHSMDYLKPGDRIRKSRPALFSIDDQKQLPVKDDLFANPWRLSDFRWAKDSSEFYFRFNQRGHQVMRLVGVDAKSGEARAIIDEVSPTFIDYNYKFKVRYLAKSNEIIWSSERDGWNHLYLYDGKTGELKNQITKGKWLVRNIDRVDEEKREIWFQAGGVIPNQDPYYIHYCRIGFDGEGLTVMTKGDGTHKVSYSPSGKYLIDQYSQVDRAPVHEVRDVETGELVVSLEESDDSQLKQAGWKAPERFVSPGRDDKTPIYGVIYRPTNFDPSVKYPVIEYIYAGPHGSFVPKSFSTIQSSQALAELGFIVVQIDGMGTSNRSKAFHDVCWKNLGDSGFPDRMRWIRAAANQYDYMDLSRVGIYGGSAGGQSSTRALLAFGDFYHVAVSDCGCHDNRMDKIWWNEQWMGWPIGPHYKEQSNVTQAHKLKGKLFLIVGELDRNVDPASTLQVVDALIKANKDFDFLMVPGGGHGIGSRTYGRRRTYDFFVRHLHGVEPRSK